MQYVDIDDEWQTIVVPEAALAFTWCQVPIVYRLGEASEMTISRADGSTDTQTEPVLSVSGRQPGDLPSQRRDSAH